MLTSGGFPAERLFISTPPLVLLRSASQPWLSTAVGQPRLGKEHHFKVGDILNDGTTGAVITAIDESESAYDVATVNTDITVTAGTKYFEGAASGTDATLKYTPNGVIKSPEWIYDGNADVPVVTMGTAREDSLTYPMPDVYKIALRGGASQTASSKTLVNVF